MVHKFVCLITFIKECIIYTEMQTCWCNIIIKPFNKTESYKLLVINSNTDHMQLLVGNCLTCLKAG